MLRRLRIENLAVVEHVELVLGPGLNVLTGSTGAGKSLILGAVNLLVGEKASTEWIRQGADDAFVEAIFDSPGSAAAAATVTVTRRIARAGRSQATIDGRAVPVRELRELCSRLIEPHGQGEQNDLRDPVRHVRYLDACADNTLVRARFDAAAAEWRRARAELERFAQEAARVREQRELYTHRLEEIDRMAPGPGEKAALESRARVMAHAEKLHATFAFAAETLFDDEQGAAVERIGEVRRRLAAIFALDERASALDASLAQAEAFVSDAAAAARDLRDSLDFEPDEVERVQSRLAELAGLERRYRLGIDALLVEAESWRRALSAADDDDAAGAALTATVSDAAVTLARVGAELTATRRAAAKQLTAAVTGSLPSLGMRGAEFRTEIGAQPARGSGVQVGGEDVAVFDDGLDVVRMRIRTNPGEAEGPLESIASTGELSRVALLLKQHASSLGVGATLVFDEIDAGVGADLGIALAENLLALAATHQIVCITHMPQIAARAASHLVVRKETDGDRTRVRVRALREDERVPEIARMLGGEEGSERRVALAAEMLSPPPPARNRSRVRP